MTSRASLLGLMLVLLAPAGAACAVDEGTTLPATTLEPPSMPAPAEASRARPVKPINAAEPAPEEPGTELSGEPLPASEPEPAAPSPRRRVFVTKDRFTGDLKAAGGGTDGLDGADRLCQRAADAAGLGGSFRAWLSTSAVDAYDRIADASPWYLVDKRTEAFASKAALKKPPQIRIALNETGQSRTQGQNYAWTGTKNDGTRDPSACADWTSSAASAAGTVGRYMTTDTWTRNPVDKGACDEPQALYCFEQ